MLLLDGIFLLVAELRGAFELAVFVEVRFETALARATHRDGGDMS